MEEKNNNSKKNFRYCLITFFEFWYFEFAHCDILDSPERGP